jgi:multidrug efflux pump subunit AcrA (membrane-fusion protein)
VKAGDTIGLVEIMKNFQPVESEAAGRLVEFLVADEDEVVAGQTVAVVDDGACSASLSQTGGRSRCASFVRFTTSS